MHCPITVTRASSWDPMPRSRWWLWTNHSENLSTVLKSSLGRGRSYPPGRRQQQTNDIHMPTDWMANSLISWQFSVPCCITEGNTTLAFGSWTLAILPQVLSDFSRPRQPNARMKNAVFWDVTPCDSCKNHTRATRLNIPRVGILHSHRHENLQILHRINRLGM
jgi:hypothetical protein